MSHDDSKNELVSRTVEMESSEIPVLELFDRILHPFLAGCALTLAFLGLFKAYWPKFIGLIPIQLICGPLSLTSVVPAIDTMPESWISSAIPRLAGESSEASTTTLDREMTQHLRNRHGKSRKRFALQFKDPYPDPGKECDYFETEAWYPTSRHVATSFDAIRKSSRHIEVRENVKVHQAAQAIENFIVLIQELWPHRNFHFFVSSASEKQSDSLNHIRIHSYRLDVLPRLMDDRFRWLTTEWDLSFLQDAVQDPWSLELPTADNLALRVNFPVGKEWKTARFMYNLDSSEQQFLLPHLWSATVFGDAYEGRILVMLNTSLERDLDEVFTSLSKGRTISMATKKCLNLFKGAFSGSIEDRRANIYSSKAFDLVGRTFNIKIDTVAAGGKIDVHGLGDQSGERLASSWNNSTVSKDNVYGHATTHHGLRPLPKLTSSDEKDGDSSINEEEGEVGDVGPLMNVRASLGRWSSSKSLVAGSAQLQSETVKENQPLTAIKEMREKTEAQSTETKQRVILGLDYGSSMTTYPGHLSPTKEGFHSTPNVSSAKPSRSLDFMTDGKPFMPNQIPVKVRFDGNFVSFVVPSNIQFRQLTGRIDAKLSRFTDQSIASGSVRLWCQDENEGFISIGDDDALQNALRDWRWTHADMVTVEKYEQLTLYAHSVRSKPVDGSGPNKPYQPRPGLVGLGLAPS